jgi:HAD superfamily hydrolase (TIGR01662 family)
MSEKRLFMFDVDGTLIRSYMEKPHPKEEYAVAEVLPRRVKVIRKLADEGASFALVTNQAGVAMGYQEPLDVWRKMGKVIAHLEGFYGRPFSIHVCMHHPAARVERWREDPCPRRKPEPAMLFEAMLALGWSKHRVYAGDKSDCLYVGDEPKDREAAERAGIDFDDAEHFFNHAVRLHS